MLEGGDTVPPLGLVQNETLDSEQIVICSILLQKPYPHEVFLMKSNER